MPPLKMANMVGRLFQSLKLIDLLRRQGPKWLIFRVGYAIQRKLGFQRRKFSPFRWDEKPLSTWLKPEVPANPTDYLAYRRQSGGRFFFQGDEQVCYRPILEKLVGEEQEVLFAEIDKLAGGTFTFFSKSEFQVGIPPDWHTHVLTARRLSPWRHWTEIHDLDPDQDIKFVWELSRFSFVFPLVRAYWLTGDERYPQIFWRLIENWLEQNPPQLGPNWMCGQEATFRLMAWIFGLYGFNASTQSTPER
ncbi:MAG: heparinase II/III family protein, partial [Chloroflexota bacterium]